MTDPINQPNLVLDGLNGWVRGESHQLTNAAALSIGRSRSCDISLRRCQGYRHADPATRDQDHDFNTVSRRHLTLTIDNWEVRISDESTNGTFVDDTPVDGTVTIAMEDHAPVVLRLGTREAFILRRSDDDRLPQHDDKGDPSLDADSTNHTEPCDPSQRTFGND